MPNDRHPPSRQISGASYNCFLATSPPSRIAFWRLEHLDSQAKKLISSWFEKAWERRNAKGEDAFEPFIFAWFSINAWASCVTNTHRDAEYMGQLISNPELQVMFSDLCHNDTDFAAMAHEFSECWPIFDVRSLRWSRVDRRTVGDRREIVQQYIDGGANRFEPRCWQRHTDSNEPVPCDWPHTMAAIYRVRCNLFHGEKSADAMIDQQIVRAAFRVLINFFRKTGYL